MIHIVYDKHIQEEDTALDLGNVFRDLGLEVKEHYVTYLEAENLQIPLNEFVFLHLDRPANMPFKSEFKMLRMLEQKFPKKFGFLHEFSENCIWKSVMSELFQKNQVPHCRTQRIERIDEEIQIEPPYFIKLDDGMNSTGLEPGCFAKTKQEAIKMCGKLIQLYGPVAVQHYLSGREFTVACYGNGIAMHPIERIFDEGEFYSPPNGTNREKVLEDRDLIMECKRVASMAFKAINPKQLMVYGRVDLRSDEKGCIYALEVNDTCGFGPNSYFELSCKAANSTRQKVIEYILNKLY